MHQFQECKADFRERRRDPEPEYRERNQPLLAHPLNKLSPTENTFSPKQNVNEDGDKEHDDTCNDQDSWALVEAITLSSSHLLTPTATCKPPNKCGYYHHVYSVNAEPEAYGG